jgi:hypothetical protein
MDGAAEDFDRAARAVKDEGKRLTQDGKALIETASRRITLSLPGNVKLDVPENS